MKRRARVLLTTLSLAVVAALGASQQAAAVGVGHSGWSWGNPTPQGEEINSLDFSGNRGYAAGKFGTLLRTDDGGSSWNGIATGITQDLARVSIIDDNSLAIAGGCSVRRSDDAGQTFTRLAWTASDTSCSSAVASLDFASDQAGYLLVSDGGVLSTTDGGKSWSRKTGLPQTKVTGGSAVPTDIAFTSPSTGVATTNSGRIYRTTDGGQSWALVANHSKAFNGLFFADATVGYAVGAGSSVFKTTDAGANWVEKANGSLDFSAIRCATIDQCIITVRAGDRIVLSVQDAAPEDGLTFTSVTPSSDKVFAAGYASPSRAVAAGAFGTTVLSNDAGVNWSQVGSRLTTSYTRIRATSSSVAFAAGKAGAVAKTLDGGKSWAKVSGPTGSDVIDVAFPTSSIGFALDDSNGVSRTDNGGSSWQILNPGTPRSPQAILAPNADTVVLVGPLGLSRSTDGGDSFNRVKGRTIDRSKLFDGDMAGTAMVAYGAKRILVSTTRGKTWRKVPQPKRTALSSVDFITSKFGYALSQDGRVWKTTNGGRHWADMLAVGSDRGYALSFSSATSGFLLISRFGESSNGYLLRTTDGGKTWNPQLTSQDQVASVAATNGTDYALAGSNDLLYTTTGGQLGATSKLTIKTKRKTVKRRQTIKVTGKVSDSQQGEKVVVARRYRGENGWDYSTATIASNGTFTTTWKMRKQSYFVAQFAGNADRAGDGTATMVVKTKR